MNMIIHVLGWITFSFLTLSVMIILGSILFRMYVATLDLTCSLIRVRRKRLPRHKWACTPWEAWCWSFWNARASDVHEKAWELRQNKVAEKQE